MSENLREAAKREWSGDPTLEGLRTGALLRIADATQKMASNIVAIETDRDYYKRRVKDLNEANDRLRRRISALKGVITKLKKGGSDV